MSYWQDTIERTVRTAVQASAAAVLALWIDAGSLNDLDWNTLWQVAVYASAFTILTALAGKTVGDSNSPSLLK
jgi:ABC-type enterobactin transport system permease subunit